LVFTAIWFGFGALAWVAKNCSSTVTRVGVEVEVIKKIDKLIKLRKLKKKITEKIKS
jgi:hypothetical protein